MAYLESAEYLAYGLSADTADAWVGAASAMVEAYCRRASLLSASYTERLRVSRVGCVQLTYGPVLSVTALQARYARAPMWGCEGPGLLPFALAFGLPGQWVALDPSTVMLESNSGEVQMPMSVMGLAFQDVEISYTAGLASVPDAVKVACAQIVKNAEATPGLNVRSSKLDTVQTQYFSDSLLDSQVKSLLRPYVAERVGR